MLGILKICITKASFSRNAALPLLVFTIFQTSIAATAAIAASVAESTPSINRWEALIAHPPEPDQLTLEIDSLSLELANEGLTPEERSTLLRTLAFLESLQPNTDFASVNDRLSTAIQAVKALPPEQAGPLIAKAYLNQSALARRFMEKELQKAVLYGLKQEDFFRIMTTYYQPARSAIRQGLQSTEDPLMQLHFHLAASSLAYTFAHCTQAFSDASASSIALFTTSAEGARTVLRSIDKRLEATTIPKKERAILASLRRSALNNLAATTLYVSLPPEELNKLLEDLIRSAQEPDCPMGERVACYATALHIARSALPLEQRSAFLRNTTPPATALLDAILTQQKNISTSMAEGGAMLSLLDEYSHFVSTLVLSLLDQGEAEQAFEVVRRSKWSTLASIIAPPESDYDALKSRLEARDALLVEQFLSHEGLIQFLLSGDTPLRVVRNEQNNAHSLASGVAKHFTASSQASPLRLLLRNRPQLYTEFLIQGQSLYQEIFETSGIDREFSQFSEILIAPHLILAYIPYAGLPVSFDPAAPLAATLLCEIAPPISTIPSSLLLADDSNARHFEHDILYFARSDFKNQAPHYGSDLPGVLQEIQASRQTMPGAAHFEADASEHTFWQDAHKARVLYLATHGIAKPDRPLDSHLLLAETDPQSTSRDGYLTVRELLLRSLDTTQPQIAPDLAVLSACVTALSEKNPMYGDDLASLSRALLASGCQQVIGTLWDAHDETYAKLMPAMLSQVADGIRPSVALWQAQREQLTTLKQEPRISPLAAPFFWASASAFGRL